MRTGKRGRGARCALTTVIALLGTAACVSGSGRAPAGQPAGVLAAAAPPPGGCEMPVRERASEIGCYLTAIEQLGVLPGSPLFWHLDQFSSRAAAEAAKGPR